MSTDEAFVRALIQAHGIVDYGDQVVTLEDYLALVPEARESQARRTNNGHGWRANLRPGDVWWIDEGRPGVFSRPAPGDQEGDRCNRSGCDGVIELSERENCSCHINPPCHWCMNRHLCCSACDWEEPDDDPAPATQTQADKDVWAGWRAEQERIANLPLDNTKISWRSRPHSSCSMIKEGVYPEGATRSEVEKEVVGTFGGHFNHFGGGKFEYTAYTD